MLISNKVLTKLFFTKKIITIFTFNNNEKKTIMIENPFEFGRAVEDEYFTDRINDAKRLELWMEIPYLSTTHSSNCGSEETLRSFDGIGTALLQLAD